MAQDSAFHQGTSLGHAASTDLWAAPYSAAEFSSVMRHLLGISTGLFNYGGVVPEYGNELQVTANSPANMSVNVATGAAVVFGKVYENTATVNLSVSASDATNPRVDMVVLRYDSSIQTIVLAIKTGTAAASPTAPTMTHSATVDEFPLAMLWIEPTSTSVPEVEIHEKRVFIRGHESSLKWSTVNLLENSEFMALSSTGAGVAPDRWDVVSTISNLADPGTIFQKMSRGRAINITAGASSSGIQQRVRAQGGLSAGSVRFTVKGLVQSTVAGDVGLVSVQFGSTTISKYYHYGFPDDEIVIYGPSMSSDDITVKLLCVNNGDIIKYGQFMVVPGLDPGPFRPKNEVILLDEPLTDASWNATAYSTGTSTIDLTANFESMITSDVRGILLQVEANDSGSAAGTAEVGIRGPAVASTHDVARLYLRGTPNDIKRGLQCWVPIAQNLSSLSGDLFIDRVATGASTLDITLRIHGIIT